MDGTRSGQGLTPEVQQVLLGIRHRGIQLWSENGQLRYRGPKGALTQEEKSCLKVHRDLILAFLESEVSSEDHEPQRLIRPRQDRAPLSFAQLAHWHLYRLSDRPSCCVIPCATRLHGPLDIAALRESLARLVHRHDALRTRIILLEETPAQEISESQDYDVPVEDLTELSEELRELQVRRTVECLVREPMEVIDKPLCRIRLLQLTSREHVLVIAMEHIISDGVSLDLLVKELLSIYRTVTAGCALSLPDIPLQLSDYAFWQRATHSTWLERHGRYWEPRVSKWWRSRFPEDTSTRSAENSGWGVAAVRIGSTLRSQLGEWCKQHQTTLVMGALTAYVALVLRWCDTSEGVILFHTDGRHSALIENTVGYFAFSLYLRIELRKQDRFADLLHRVTDEYCAAYEHADFAYLHSQNPPPEFTRNTCFNWLRVRPPVDQANILTSEGSLESSVVQFDESLEQRLLIDIQRDTEPSVGLLETDDSISGGVYFPKARFSAQTMERFARNYLAFVNALLERPESPVSELALL